MLRIDSPGGDAYSSELIRREIAQTRSAGKPVVVSMGDVAASGGYWIAMDGDEIWAEPTTITGSIGIFGLVVTIPETLAKIGVHTDGIGTTPLAGTFDIRRPLSPELESILNSVIRHGYSEFIGHVAKARKRTPEEIDASPRVACGAGARPRNAASSTSSADSAMRSHPLPRAQSSARTTGALRRARAEHVGALCLSFGESETMMRIARSVGFSLPAGWLDRARSPRSAGSSNRCAASRTARSRIAFAICARTPSAICVKPPLPAREG